MGSVEEMITVTIHEVVDFWWIWSSGCLDHRQNLVDGIGRDITRIAIPWWVKQTERSLS